MGAAKAEHFLWAQINYVFKCIEKQCEIAKVKNALAKPTYYTMERIILSFVINNSITYSKRMAIYTTLFLSTIHEA
jgi:hypothetical protein